MVSTFHGLELGKRSLYAQQKAINTTGHNISNANTKGYSRQQVNLATTNPLAYNNGNNSENKAQLGTGVIVSSITRAREAWSDEQFRTENAHVGEWKTKQSTFEQVESAMLEPSESGLNHTMNRFWNSWHDLSTDPSNMAVRQVVVQSSLDVVSTAKIIHSSLNDVKRNVSNQKELLIDKANGYLDRIQHLNNEIVKFGEGQNDFKDKRDLLVDDLSKLIDVNVKLESNGSYHLSLKGSNVNLIKDGQVSHISNASDIRGGSLYGASQSEQMVEDKINKLNHFVKTFMYGEVTVQLPTGEKKVDGVNGLHRAGYALREDGNGKAESGIDLFIGNNSNDFSIENIRVNETIVNDVSMIAASSRTDTNGKAYKGNGDIAVAIGMLRNTDFSFENASSGGTDNVSPSHFYNQFITELGIQAEDANQKIETYESISAAIEQRRQSISGVSLDEEMANLVKFQHAYNASARIVTAVDEMLDTIINRMGAR